MICSARKRLLCNQRQAGRLGEAMAEQDHSSGIGAQGSWLPETFALHFARGRVPTASSLSPLFHPLPSTLLSHGHTDL